MEILKRYVLQPSKKYLQQIFVMGRYKNIWIFIGFEYS